MSFLQQILPSKQAEVLALQAALARATPTRSDDCPVRDFAAALQGGNRLIAEIKRKSPSHPAFRQLATPTTLARAYRRNGAAALSIVTDDAHFGTSLEDVATVKAAVALPVLVKDFVIDEVQLLAAWAAGADAVLLIVRMLDGPRLGELLRYAESLGLHVLVECHDRADIDLALAAEASLIGVNNRDLATLTTDLAHGAAMLPFLARPAVRVSESGLYRRADIEHMAALGADAFLVGHALLSSRDPGRKVAELAGRESETGLRVKACGITSAADARLAHRAGAHLLGLIFAPGARQIDAAGAGLIRQAVPAARLCGVFMDAPVAEIARAAASCDLDLIQLHGTESPQLCREVAAATGRPLIKALTADLATPEQAAAYEAAAYFLVDLPKGRPGHGLVPADCRAAARSLAAAGHEVFLAGGLTPENVQAAVAEVRPYGVDVASGIETSPRTKNENLIRTFIAEANR
jgi:indole-3-glycerol phosphate synthase/phosphoribosylanthranilate isomerase